MGGGVKGVDPHLLPRKYDARKECAMARSRRRTKKGEGWRLKTVRLTGLFSKYDFPAIDLSHQTSGGDDLTLLYGDNGTGKTTILKLIFAALSSERNAGNRGFLGSTPFQSLELEFEDEQIVTVYREGKKTKNDYIYRFSGPRVDWEFEVYTEPNGKVGDRRNPEIDSLSDILSENFPPIVFLNDHRTFKTSFNKPSSRFIVESETGQLVYSEEAMRRNRSMRLDGDIEDFANLSLENLLHRARDLLSSRALRGTAKANEGSGQVYLNAAKAVARAQRKRNHDLEKPTSQSVISSIEKLIPRTRLFREVGLREGESLQEILHTINGAKGVKREQIADLVKPYISSIESRVEKNNTVVELAHRYQRNVNLFINRKNLKVDIGEDIKIFDDSGNEISLSSLSSGERQILNLCTVALLSSEENNIIMIDEPEISLNYKWQKQLVDSLLEIAGKNSQFVLATHSFEIIANHRSCLEAIEPA